MAKVLRPAAFLCASLCILALGVTLRRHGNTWGLPRVGGVTTASLHPDERSVMGGLAEAKISTGELFPQARYICGEGQLQYTIWAVVLNLAKKVGAIERTPDESRAPIHEAHTLALLRELVVAVDVLAMVVLLTLGRRTFGAIPALVAALVWAVLPAFNVAAHFARTHTLADLFVLLVFFACASLDRRIDRPIKRSWPWWLLAGGLVGLAATTRYNMLTLGLFPAVVAVRCLATRGKAIGQRLAGPAIAGVGLVAGILLGLPVLLRDPPALLDGLSYQREYINPGQFAGWSLLSLDTLVPYLTWLLPIGGYPVLWIPLYVVTVLAAVFALRKREWLSLAIPLYAVLYLYGMAKGYWQPWFVRAALPSLAAGVLALAYVLTELGAWPRLRTTVAVLTVLFCVPSAQYVWAYGTAMKESDAYEQAAAWIENHVPPDTTIGLLTEGSSVRPWPREMLGKSPRPPSTEAGVEFDWLIFCAQRDWDFASSTPARYTTRQVFRTQVRTPFGAHFEHERWPEDWSYPFPTVWIAERNKTSPSRPGS